VRGRRQVGAQRSLPRAKAHGWNPIPPRGILHENAHSPGERALADRRYGAKSGNPAPGVESLTSPRNFINIVAAGGSASACRQPSLNRRQSTIIPTVLGIRPPANGSAAAGGWGRRSSAAGDRRRKTGQRGGERGTTPGSFERPMLPPRGDVTSPIEITVRPTAKLLAHAELLVYERVPHGIPTPQHRPVQPRLGPWLGDDGHLRELGFVLMRQPFGQIGRAPVRRAPPPLAAQGGESGC
jgi:hypothetical protein